MKGAVGAGTGTVAFGFKGGIGTSSRKLPANLGGYSVGVLVQSNFGGILTINGAPCGSRVGAVLFEGRVGRARALVKNTTNSSLSNTADGSIIIVIATDAPIDHRNLQRLAARAMIGTREDRSRRLEREWRLRDCVLNCRDVFACAPTTIVAPQPTQLLSNEAMSPLFLAVIEATEEAIYNSLFRATTISGRGHTVEALPIDRTLEILRKYNALKR